MEQLHLPNSKKYLGLPIVHHHMQNSINGPIPRFHDLISGSCEHDITAMIVTMFILYCLVEHKTGYTSYSRLDLIRELSLAVGQRKSQRG